MQSCKLFGTSRLAGGFLFIQEKRADRLLCQPACFLMVRRGEQIVKSSICFYLNKKYSIIIATCMFDFQQEGSF